MNTERNNGHAGDHSRRPSLVDISSAENMARAGLANVEAEAAVLGSIIIDPDAVEEVIGFLLTEDFYRDAHRTIYETILALHQEQDGTPADFITICDDLDAHGKLDHVGGASYITSLINQVPTSGNAEYYGRIVTRCAIMRDLTYFGGRVSNVIADNPKDAQAALAQVESLFYAMATKRVKSNLVSLSNVLEANMLQLERASMASEQGHALGLMFGFPALDTMLGGLFPGDLVVIAGRPGDGKTSLALSLARALGKKGKKMLFFSLEMPKEQLGLRLLAMEAGVDQEKLRLGQISTDPVIIDGEQYSSEWESVVAASDRLSEMFLWIEDSAGMDTLQLRSLAKRVHAQEGGINAIWVDYLQLVQVRDSNDENRSQVIGKITLALRTLGRELGVPVIALSQLNRAVEGRADRRPQMSDLREGGAIENDADKIMFLFRPPAENGEDNVVEADGAVPRYVRMVGYIAKNRNSKIGDVPLVFIPERTQFVPAASW